MWNTSRPESGEALAVREGQHVFDRDGQRLGRIRAVGDGWFLVEQGFFRPRETELQPGQVFAISGDAVYVRLTREEVRWQPPGSIQHAPPHRVELPPGKGELRVPLVREEAEVVRHVHVGAVRLRREVVTEMRQITVPVRREVLRVERVDGAAAAPASEGTIVDLPAGAEEGSFELELHEDEIEVTTRPVVRERVRVARTRRREERQLSVPLRSQQVEVERRTAAAEPTPER